MLPMLNRGSDWGFLSKYMVKVQSAFKGGAASRSIDDGEWSSWRRVSARTGRRSVNSGKRWCRDSSNPHGCQVLLGQFLSQVWWRILAWCARHDCHDCLARLAMYNTIGASAKWAGDRKDQSMVFWRNSCTKTFSRSEDVSGMIIAASNVHVSVLLVSSASLQPVSVVVALMHAVVQPIAHPYCLGRAA